MKRKNEIFSNPKKMLRVIQQLQNQFECSNHYSFEVGYSFHITGSIYVYVSIYSYDKEKNIFYEDISFSPYSSIINREKTYKNLLSVLDKIRIE